METPTQGNGSPDPRLPEFLVRTVRHDIGDFLQTVYSAVALLQHRLPPECEQERTILGNLRIRAGSCKDLLDTLHDLVCSPSLSYGPVQLAEVVEEQLKSARGRFPHLHFRSEVEGPFPIRADGPRLGHVINLMLTNACQAAQRQVLFRIAWGPTPEEVEWSVRDDGPNLSSEQQERIFRPFPILRRGTLEVGLAPARQIVLLHGGRIAASNLPGQGLEVQVVLPRQPPEENST